MTDPVALLKRSKRIAVVGCSATPGKDAHEVPRFALAQGYDVLPVNPSASSVFDRPAYKALADVPGRIDIVNVFRPAPEAPEVARQAVAVGAKAIWLQLGIRSDEARRIARDAGLDYVEDACLRTEIQKMG